MTDNIHMGHAVASNPRPATPPAPQGVEPTLDEANRIIAAIVEITAAEGDLHSLGAHLSLLSCAVAEVDGAVVEVVQGTHLVYAEGAGILAGRAGTRVARSASLSGLVVSTATAALCDDTERDTRVEVATCQALGIRSMAVLPIRHGHHTYAVLKLASSEPFGITARQAGLVDPLVRAAAARWASVTANDINLERLTRLAIVTGLSKEVLLSEDPSKRLLDTLATAAGAKFSYLFLLEADELVLHAQRGSNLEQIRLPLDEQSLAVTAFRSGRPKVVADWMTHPDVTDAARNRVAGHGLETARSAAYIPLDTHEGPIGVLCVLFDEPITASNADLLGLMQLLAAEAGIAITRDTLRRRLADQARTDPLTDLPNRRVWQERIELEVVRSVRVGAPLAVVMLDLDNFKAYNDTFGHPAGDVLLAETASDWSDLIRPTDLLARLGGEEFGLLLPDTDLPAAIDIAERLCAAVPGEETVSVGVTLFVSGEAVADAVSRADAALYDAKSAGRNRVNWR